MSNKKYETEFMGMDGSLASKFPTGLGTGNVGLSNYVSPTAAQLSAFGTNPLISQPQLFPGTSVAVPGVAASMAGWQAGPGAGGNQYSFLPKERTDMPDVEGKWMNRANMALTAAQVGTSIYGAVQQAKMNKFMQSYYQDSMDRANADFTNTVQAANESLSSKRERQLSAQGVATGSQEMQQGVASYMDQWGAKNKV